MSGHKKNPLDFRATEGTGAGPSWFAPNPPFLPVRYSCWWLGFWSHPFQALWYSHSKTSGVMCESWSMEKDGWLLLEPSDSRSMYMVHVSFPRVLIKSSSCSHFCVWWFPSHMSHEGRETGHESCGQKGRSKEKPEWRRRERSCLWLLPTSISWKGLEMGFR